MCVELMQKKPFPSGASASSRGSFDQAFRFKQKHSMSADIQYDSGWTSDFRYHSTSQAFRHLFFPNPTAGLCCREGFS